MNHINPFTEDKSAEAHNTNLKLHLDSWYVTQSEKSRYVPIGFLHNKRSCGYQGIGLHWTIEISPSISIS